MLVRYNNARTYELLKICDRKNTVSTCNESCKGTKVNLRRKRMKKKIISALLCVAMVATVAVG